jgi:small-conductance mechanosensitive channel
MVGAQNAERKMNDWTSHLVNGLLIAGTAVLGLVAVHLIARRMLARVQTLERVREARRQQLVTLVQMTQWIVIVLLVISALLMLLSEFGIDITPLLASVGVAGLAVSLGAQSLIKDLIGGLLILIENQYAVGDSIVVGTVSGQVERITLRTTQVRAFNGDLYTVPNGEVRVLANQTRDWSQAVIDVGIAYEEDLDRALGILEESVAAFAQDPAFEADLMAPSQVLGVHSLGDSAVLVRIVVKTQPGKQQAIGRALRKFLLEACEREGVSLPYPRQEVWVRAIPADVDVAPEVPEI